MKRVVGLLAVVLFAAACGDPNPKITYSVKMTAGEPDSVTITYNEHMQTNTVEVTLPWTHSFKAESTESLYVAVVASNTSPTDESLAVRVAISQDGDETEHGEAQGIDLVSASVNDSL